MAINLFLIIEQILHFHDLDYLRQYYDRHGMTTSFDDAKKHYVGHLLATIAAKDVVMISPPLHVDVLWHGHLLDTKRWRVFEKLVIAKYIQSGRQTNMEYIDHSVEDNILRQDERMETRRFIKMGLEFNNDDDNNNANVISSGNKRERTEHTVNEDREKRTKIQTENNDDQQEEIIKKAREELSRIRIRVMDQCDE